MLLLSLLPPFIFWQTGPLRGPASPGKLQTCKEICTAGVRRLFCKETIVLDFTTSPKGQERPLPPGWRFILRTLHSRAALYLAQVGDVVVVVIDDSRPLLVKLYSTLASQFPKRVT